jgi:hypothetical protein
MQDALEWIGDWHPLSATADPCASSVGDEYNEAMRLRREMAPELLDEQGVPRD